MSVVTLDSKCGASNTRPLRGSTMNDAPSYTSWSWPPTWFTYTMGKAVLRARLAEDLVPHRALADVRRARIDGHHDVRRRVLEPHERVYRVIPFIVVPAVFADHEADAHVVDVEHAGHVGTGLEVPALVEDVVGGQQLLGVREQHLPVLSTSRLLWKRLPTPVLRVGAPMTQCSSGSARDSASICAMPVSRRRAKSASSSRSAG
jgi:hypothetical protein